MYKMAWHNQPRPGNVGDILTPWSFHEDTGSMPTKVPFENQCKIVGCGPSFWTRGLYKLFAGTFDPSVNPEMQLRVKEIKRKHLTVLGKKPVVQDIGREWLSSTSWKRPAAKGNFVTWEKK
jgi:hypothetical protein